MNLYLVRHGRTQYNEKSILTGHHDPQLTQDGHTQGSLLAKHFSNTTIDTIYYADFVRTKTTADYFKTTHPSARFIQDPLFRERTYGTFDGWQKEKIRQHFSTPDLVYQKVPYNLVCKSIGAETHEQTLTRTHRALEHLRATHHTNDTILIISSSGFINFLRICLLYGPHVQNTEVYKVSFPAASISFYTLSSLSPDAKEHYVASVEHLT